MGQNKRKLSGVFSPVVTPFHSDELALDDLRFNLRKLNETNLAGYLALGSNGEFKSLNDKEQYRILEVFAEEKGNKVVLVGAGCESTRQTIEKSKLAAEMGFDYVSILTPSYFAKQIDGLLYSVTTSEYPIRLIFPYYSTTHPALQVEWKYRCRSFSNSQGILILWA